MANKERNKRSARQARARERAALEAAHAASAPADDKKKAKSAAPVRVERSAPAKEKNTGFFGRVRTYFSDVRTEMHRVVWPSRTELKNYSVAVLAMLIVAGVAIWLVDTGFVALLVGFTGLRGA